MFINNSPWIYNLKRTRPEASLEEDTDSDITIIGGGISGVTTAYFILKNTDRKVLLIEADKIAHGATGHNAGQVVSYFEKQISGISKKYGKDLARDAQKSIDSAWNLIEEIYEDTKITTPFSQFTGYAGLQDFERVLIHLENNLFAKDTGINAEKMIISENWEKLKKIPEKYKDLYSTAPQEDILSLLETKNKNYIALISSRKGCINSATFCEEITGFLLSRFSGRFSLSENTLAERVVLNKEEKNEIRTSKGLIVKCNEVILCTNGFQKITIENKAGKNEINSYFHSHVSGYIAYMAGYLDKLKEQATAISYLPKGVNSEEPYIYLTRRPFELEKNEKHNIICIGGPEALMDDSNGYSKDKDFPEEAINQIDNFLKKDFSKTPKEFEYKFKWHGLMGYTPNEVRIIGKDPENSELLYNLGCNGVGILPSLYGAKRISQIIKGEKMKPSIFDPQKK